MPKRSSNRNNIKDVNALATHIVEQAIGESVPSKQATESSKNPAAVALGRLGGKKGGPACARKLPAEQRKEIAKRASAVR